MKGKKGPRPPIDTTVETPPDPTAEQIVGEENVVDVGEAETVAVIDRTFKDNIEQLIAERSGYKCNEVGCPFNTPYLSEMEEHVSGTGHGGYVTDILDPPVQPELFSESGIVQRSVEVPIHPEVLNEKRIKLAELYQDAIDVKALKKGADASFNAQLSSIDEDMQAIARILKTPFIYEAVDCEWRNIDGENASGLYRLDTGEQIDKRPLSQEDRQQELDAANQANAQPAEAAV